MASQNQSQFEHVKVITADTLIPGKGQPISSGAIAYQGKRIIFAGPKHSLPAEYQSVKSAHFHVIMPGLWDCHVHFLGSPRFSFDTLLSTPLVLVGARSAHDASQIINAGFTSVREMGGHGVHLATAIEEGVVIGPNIYPACCLISQTGGHADAHNVPVNVFCEAVSKGQPFCVCDGVDECIKGVRTQLRHGAKVIKICASGGVVSSRDNPNHQQFSVAEMRVMVEEAARADRIVGAHCHGKAGIMAALEAGVKTIEHGTYLDDEAIQALIEYDAILVPTRSAITAALQLKGAFDPDSYAKLAAIVPQHLEAYGKAIRAGVRIALGTDFGVSTPGTVLSHGNNGRELLHAVEAGMTPLQAIEAATANAPATLGPQAPLSGQLLAGYDADFIALSKNPAEDINVLSDTTNITHVWKGGKLLKSPEAPVHSSSEHKGI
ncbi:hypothetical protein NQ176_g6168 [Zarea fungicola]|uniref:Uncharacterized protein n=1 Tax=Zarea fungicola TaxID=93591 RepID=A0ACC1N6Z8_9HYPO|nr:hypothetical protein NQ176_g6168 [Lecanicillium fungicola]